MRGGCVSRQVSESVCPKSTTLLALLQQRKRQRAHVPTYMPTLDAALRGGITVSGAPPHPRELWFEGASSVNELATGLGALEARTV